VESWVQRQESFVSAIALLSWSPSWLLMVVVAAAVVVDYSDGDDDSFVLLKVVVAAAGFGVVLTRTLSSCSCGVCLVQKPAIWGYKTDYYLPTTTLLYGQ
jgi:hypothetical protein